VQENLAVAYKNKTYIAFDGDKDIHYYRLMTAWSANPRFDFEFHDAHDLNTARDSSQEESIKKQLRERFANSKVFIVLIGESTRNLTKFVKWEIEVAVRLDLPIIAINLNDSRGQDSRCPASLKDALAIYVPFNEKIITYALNNWPTWDPKHRTAGKTGPFHYEDATYKSFGL
jgi:hypothetical protein